MSWCRCEESRELMAQIWKKFGHGPFRSWDVFGEKMKPSLMSGAYRAGWITPIEKVRGVNTWVITKEGKMYAERWLVVRE